MHPCGTPQSIFNLNYRAENRISTASLPTQLCYIKQLDSMFLNLDQHHWKLLKGQRVCQYFVKKNREKSNFIIWTRGQ